MPIEGGVDDLNSSMVELLLLVKYDLPDEASGLSEVGIRRLLTKFSGAVEVNELFSALSDHFEKLRKELWLLVRG